MSWVCCPCRCRRRIKSKAVHTISATIRCNGVDPVVKQAPNLEKDGTYKEPISDLAQQAYKHLEFVEEERKRGSRVFDSAYDNGVDQPDNSSSIHHPSCQYKHDNSGRTDVQAQERKEQREYQTEESTPNKSEMMTSTEMATTQEIETQVEAKQFHEQFCQSDDLPAEQVKGTESKIDTDTTDQVLQQFNDLHKNLLNWLEETEELVENQKLPSSDYKVVKAQLQNHDFQTKLVDDKQESFDRLLSLGDQLHKFSTLSEEDRRQVHRMGDETHTRFLALSEDVHRRRQILLDAQELANDFHRTQQPLSTWLEDASQQVTALCKVVTTKEEIEANIAKQEILKREIDSKRETFDVLVECYTQLVKLVGPDDASELDATVRNLSTRYDELGRRCVQCGHALHGFSEDMSSFLADTDELVEWLDQIEKEFERLGDLPLDGQELVSLSEEFAELANAISERSESVSRIVDESREICTHTSGSEAMAMSSRIDRLHSRYNQLLNASMERIEVFATAIRVSDGLVDLVEQLEDFMDACDDATNTLDDSAIDEQLECVSGLDDELQKNAPLIDDVEEMSHQLRALSNKPDSYQNVELLCRSDELRHRFASIRTLIEERKRRLQLANSQGRETFDALDFWLEFFEDAFEQNTRADKPPADLEQLKDLMHKQRVLNERIAAERSGVRDLIAEASRVSKDINSSLGAEDSQLDAKIERIRKLVELTAEAGAERMAILEQVYEICKELVPAYEELTDGMSKLELEFQKCRPINTGQPIEELREQLDHNNKMLQLVRAEKQNLSKFEQNIDAIFELCAKEDGNHLKKLCEQLRERHADIQGAFTGRGDALERTIADNSKFDDRFSAFLSSLETAAAHARQLDPISSRPPILRHQLQENSEAIRLWQQKSSNFDAMRSSALDLLAQSKHNEAQVMDLSHKLAALDELWLEIRSAYDARDRQIRTTLSLAERFWTSSADTQSLFKSLRVELTSLPEAGIEPASIANQAILLDRVKNQLASATPQFEALHRNAAELLMNVGDDTERSFVEQQLQTLDHEWHMLSQSFSQRSAQLGTTHDKTNQYVHACQLMQQWLQQADEQLQHIVRNDVSNAPLIRATIDQLQTLRSALNSKALERDDLNRMANELCACAQPQQVSAIRTPLRAIGEQFNRLYALIGEKQHRLEKSLLDLGQFEQAYAQLISWLSNTDNALQLIHDSAVVIGDSDAKKIEIELAKLIILKRDISAHVPSFDAIEKTAALLKGDPNAAQTTASCSQLLSKWSALQTRANDLHAQLEQQHSAATSKTSQLDRWSVWLSDVLTQLSSNKPVGALPETVATQLADLRLLVDDVEQKRPQLEHDLQEAQKRLDAAQNPDERQWIQDSLGPVQQQWNQVNERLKARESKLKKAEIEAIDLANQMNSMSDWVQQAENALNTAAPISRLPDKIQKQIDEHATFVDMSQSQRATMATLSNRGLKVQMTCEKKDAIPIKNQLVSLKNRNERIAQRAVERQKQMTVALKEAKDFEGIERQLNEFVSRMNQELSSVLASEPTTGDRIRDQLEQHRNLEEDLSSYQALLASSQIAGRSLVEAAPPNEKRDLAKRTETLRARWTDLEDKMANRKRLLDDALVQSGKFDEALAQLLSWLNEKLPPIELELKEGKMHGDVETLQALIKENDKLSSELKTRRSALETIQKRAEDILSNDLETSEDQEEIKRKMNRLNEEWERLERAVSRKAKLLNDSLPEGVDLTEFAHELHEKLNDFELRVRRDLHTSTDRTDVASQFVESSEKLNEELKTISISKDKFGSLVSSVLQKAHPRAIIPVKELKSTVQSRFNDVGGLLDERIAEVRQLHTELTGHDALMQKIGEFVANQQVVLTSRNNKCEKTWTLPEILDLIHEHSDFKELIRSHQPEMDEIIKLAKRQNVLELASGNIEEDAKGSQANLSKSMNSISGTLPRQKSTGGKSKLLPEKQTITKRQRRADQLNETWNQLWNDTVITEDRIKERKADIEELRRLENFTFAEWRERYLAWNDSAKARISDLFRRIDKQGEGFVPRQQFIDGVLSSKFPTTRLEMDRVADEFDKDGKISSREFMNALRYEGRNRRLLQQQKLDSQKSDPERIHTEIRREAQRCQCAHPFKIDRDNSTSSTGTVRYSFGESSIKRLVRILHSTVMVRVGGGWQELEGFLQKHDPCRAKGRTNLELNQGHEFILPFQRKPSSLSTEARKQQAEHILETYKQGPVIKIREKTERSIPMFKQPKSGTSSRSGSSSRQYSRQASDVSIKIDGSRIPRPSSSQNLATSRPSSRASNVSDMSMSFSKIPIRKTSSARQQ